MKTNIFTIIFIFFFNAIYSQVLSQQLITTIASPSANAIALGKFGEVPVSHFTGVPDISIPLYEVKGTSLTLPISLQYHAGGVMPEIHPGWVGQNWTLKAGGMITRIVNGQPDEYQHTQTFSNPYTVVYSGYFAQRSLLQNNPWYSNITIQMPYSGGSDYEPDVFNFNFLDFSGTFFLDQYGNWRVQSDRNIKVLFSSTTDIKSYSELLNPKYEACNPLRGDIKSIYKFTIIDEYGNQYIFGGNNNALEYSYPMDFSTNVTSSNYNITTTSWYLTKIISSNNDDVFDLEYVRGLYTCQVNRTYNVTTYSSCNIGPNLIWDNSGSAISPVYLKKITLNNRDTVIMTLNKSNELKFSAINDPYGYYDNPFLETFKERAIWYYGEFSESMPLEHFARFGWLKLDKMEIKNNNGSVIKSFQLLYNNNPNERLFLESLKISGSNINMFSEYNFLYSNRERLKDYGKTLADFWGYNNGSYYDNFNNIPIMAKQVNPEYLTDGMLSHIIYPTGGITHFEYEPHNYSKYVDSLDRENLIQRNGVAGGVRIKKITTTTSTNTYSKEFYYTKNYFSTNDMSSGVLNVKPINSLYINGNDELNGTPFTYGYTRSNPIIPLTKSNSSSSVTYTNVTEVEKVSGVIKGINQYTFTNHDNGYNDLRALGYRNAYHTDDYPCVSRAFERGKLLKQEIFNNQNLLKMRIVNTWSRYTNFGHEIRSLFVRNPPLCYNNIDASINYITVIPYFLLDYPFLLSKREETTYLSNNQATITDSINKVISYKHNTYKQIVNIEKNTSDNNKEITNINYSDYYITSPPNTYTSTSEYIAVKKLYDMGIIATPIEVTKLIRFSDNSSKVINSDYYEYKDSLSLVLLRKHYSLNAIDPIDSADFISFQFTSNSPYVGKDSRYQLLNKYSYYGNTSLLKEVNHRNTFITTYLWGYHNMYPIAQIVNASYSLVENILGPQKISDLAAGNPERYEIEFLSDKLRTSSLIPNSLVTTYSYYPLTGMNMMITPNGTKTHYSYDKFSRLNAVRDNSNNIVERTLYHYQNNSDFEAVSNPYTSPTTYIISCTAETGGTCSVSSEIFKAGDVINLNTEFPVNPSSSSYEFDGYYINGIKVSNPSSYSVQSTITLQARFAPIAQDFYVTVMLGSEQLLESSYSVEIQSSTGPTIASQIIKPDDPELSSLVNNNNFPVTITITTRALLPSLRITVDGTIVFDNYYGNVPSGYSFTTDPLNSGAHTVTIETP